MDRNGNVTLTFTSEELNLITAAINLVTPCGPPTSPLAKLGSRLLAANSNYLDTDDMLKMLHTVVCYAKEENLV